MDIEYIIEKLNEEFKGKEYLDKFKVLPDIMGIVAREKDITTLKLINIPARDNVKKMIIKTDVGNIIITNKATKKSAFEFVVGSIKLEK